MHHRAFHHGPHVDLEVEYVISGSLRSVGNTRRPIRLPWYRLKTPSRAHELQKTRRCVATLAPSIRYHLVKEREKNKLEAHTVAISSWIYKRGSCLIYTPRSSHAMPCHGSHQDMRRTSCEVIVLPRVLRSATQLSPAFIHMDIHTNTTGTSYRVRIQHLLLTVSCTGVGECVASSNTGETRLSGIGVAPNQLLGKGTWGSLAMRIAALHTQTTLYLHYSTPHTHISVSQ